jgi:serralysin
MCFVCFGASSISKKSSFLHEPDADGGSVIYGAIGVDEARGGAGGAFTTPATPFGWNAGSGTIAPGALVNVDEWVGLGGGNGMGGSIPIALGDSAIDGPTASFLAVNVDEAVSMSAGSLADLVAGEVIVAEADGTALPPGTVGQSSGSGGDTIAGSTATTATIATGQAVTGYANTATDSDWFSITLTAGQTYTFAAFGFGRGSVRDPEITIYDASGAQVAYDDDSGPLGYARLSFTATTSGTYYVGASGFGSGTGQYMLTANAGSTVYYPALTIPQISDQLTHTYWEANGGTAVRWNISNISFNVSALEPERAILARAAFAAWADVCNLTFTEVTSGGAIVLDDEDPDGAYANFSTSGGFIVSASINIAKAWYGGIDTLDSYTYQTYLHEIGHTLGFGHGGPYNGSATWGTDNSYANDIWQYTLMSYFDGADPSPDLASYRFTMTPMMADIYAAQTHYGARTVRATDTVYGHNSTAGSTYSFAAYSQAPSFTIWDSGGTDTLDASGYSSAQTINLTAGSLSSIGGLSNNIGIALGVTVENARGGSGADTITGNSANNSLYGNNGADVLNGGEGNDYLDGGSGVDQLFGGEGNDTILFDASDNLANVLGGNGLDTLLVRLAGSSAGAAPTSFSLTGHGFETAIVETTDSGGSLFSLITDTYNASWQLMSRVTDMDDGRDVIETWDPTNANAWSYSSETRNASGTTTNYNVNFDNGSRYERVFDATGQSWTDYLDNYNASNQLYYRSASYDDGSSYATTYDTQGQSWLQYTDYFNAVGALYNRTAVYDDGSSYATFYDVTGQSWADYTDYRNASNLLYNRSAHYDDGSGYTTFYDVSGQSWLDYTDLFNTSGQLVNRTGHYDDGSSYSTTYDAGGAYAWSSYTQYFNTSGVLINTVYTPD